MAIVENLPVCPMGFELYAPCLNGSGTSELSSEAVSKFNEEIIPILCETHDCERLGCWIYKAQARACLEAVNIYKRREKYESDIPDDEPAARRVKPFVPEENLVQQESPVQILKPEL